MVEPGGCVVICCALPCRASGKQPALGLTPFISSCRRGKCSQVRCQRTACLRPLPLLSVGIRPSTSSCRCPGFHVGQCHPTQGLSVGGGATVRVSAHATCPCTLLISPSGDTEAAGAAQASGVWGQVGKRQKALAYKPAACKICVCFWSHFYVIF